MLPVPYSLYLTYFYDDFTVTRTQVPFGVRHVFVPENYESNTYGVGRGWRLNLHQELTKDENNVWHYVDAEGKSYAFANDCKPLPNRSSIRNEELKLDLFETYTNTVQLVDRANNLFTFTNINNVYRLTCLAYYPTNLAINKIFIEYDSNSKISKV